MLLQHLKNPDTLRPELLFSAFASLQEHFLQPETDSDYLFYSETVSVLSMGDADVNAGAILRVAS